MNMLEKFAFAIASVAGASLLGSAAPPQHSAALAATSGIRLPSLPAHAKAVQTMPPIPAPPLEAPLLPPPPPPPKPEEVLEDGVLIVVSIPEQRLLVLKDGEAWDSSNVSTGKRGHETPVGTFPILQKKVQYRSTLYDDAPMPYMQRLTWDGVALHAGNVPGYPASHGCIRLPKTFAKKLYGITGFSSTVVIVTDKAVGSAKDVRKLL